MKAKGNVFKEEDLTSATWHSGKAATAEGEPLSDPHSGCQGQQTGCQGHPRDAR